MHGMNEESCVWSPPEWRRVMMRFVPWTSINSRMSCRDVLVLTLVSRSQAQYSRFSCIHTTDDASVCVGMRICYMRPFICVRREGLFWVKTFQVLDRSLWQSHHKGHASLSMSLTFHPWPLGQPKQQSTGWRVTMVTRPVGQWRDRWHLDSAVIAWHI